ncbi:MAG: hypothetical protein WC570_03370 [Patescibacteria group bacterium]
MEQKKCQQCANDFTVTDGDLDFYQKIGPTFDGKKFSIPSPTLCVDCRSQRRLAWRNERVLYNRECDLCKKQMVSLYHQDSPYTVYCQECFWSDGWDPLNNRQDYDFDRPFFAQLAEIQKTSPRLNLLNDNSENSDYANHSGWNKDCYLVYATFSCENVMYGRHNLDSANSIDCDSVYMKSQYCYECDTMDNSYKTKYSMHSADCSESSFLYDCRNCKNCYMCVNLRNKEYCIGNKQYTKEEYEKMLPDLGSRQVVNNDKKKFWEMVKNSVHVFSHQKNCENSTGDEITNLKDCFNVYDFEKSENCMNVDIGENAVNCHDCFGIGRPAENLYEIHGMARGVNCAFCHASYNSTNVYYADNCQNCQDIFGCVSLKKNQYCILNKQYSKEEYDKLAAKIIEHMQNKGEWGEFFPVTLSPFAYNETFANYYFPLDKEGAAKIGAKWLDQDYSKKYEGETYEPKDNIKDYIGNDEERQKLLDGVLKCEVTGKAYKIMSRELAFYLEQGIPIPTKHPETRFAERFARRNPRKLYKRQCMCEGKVSSGKDQGSSEGCMHEGRCINMFETTYAPDRLEKVYCEECYRKVVI